MFCAAGRRYLRIVMPLLSMYRDLIELPLPPHRSQSVGQGFTMVRMLWKAVGELGNLPLLVSFESFLSRTANASDTVCFLL
jgi:hypothetical protein